MKKKEIKQQNLKKKKQPITFQERFKNKKSIIGKLGLLELLGVQQPFNNNHENLHKQEESANQTKNKIQSTIQHLKQNKRISKLKEDQSSLKSSHLKSNKTQKAKTNKTNFKRKGSELPHISKSSANIQMMDSVYIDEKKELSTRQYWRGQMGPPLIKRRANSQLSCFNAMKNDNQANSHWKNMQKIQILSRINKRKSLLKLEPLQ